MIEAVVLIPTADNEGRRFGAGRWLLVEERLRTEFGGWTRQADVQGEWVHAGKVYADRSRQYVVVLRSWGQVPAFLEFVEWARIEFRQLALLVKIAGLPEEWRGPAGP